MVTTASTIARVGDRLLTSRVGNRLVLEPFLSWGWRRYEIDGKTPPLAYRAMRASFLAPRAAFARLEQRAAAERPLLEFSSPPDGVLAIGYEETLAALVRDGIAVLPSLLARSACDEIERCARSAVCALIGPAHGSGGREVFDPLSPRARVYDVPEQDLVATSGVQQLLADESILSLAQDYLCAAPVQDVVSCWWSVPSEGSASEAAQMFHWDLDRPRFLKLFVYLTDVGPDTGPHAFVRGTHRELPTDFRADHRYTDEKVAQRFYDQLVRIPGPRGTMFFADTRGLHKGETVVRGHRLVMSLEFASSLFGQSYTRPVVQEAIPAFAQAKRRFPSVYRRFTLPAQRS